MRLDDYQEKMVCEFAGDDADEILAFAAEQEFDPLWWMLVTRGAAIDDLRMTCEMIFCPDCGRAYTRTDMACILRRARRFICDDCGHETLAVAGRRRRPLSARESLRLGAKCLDC